MKELTDKEKKFCLGIAEGKSQYQAYLDAYNVKTDKRGSIDNMAHAVIKKPHVSAYLQKLRKKVDDNATLCSSITKEKKINLIWEQIQKCIDNNDNASIARYLEILNKLQGHYVNTSKIITEENQNFSDLSIDEIKDLLKSEK